MEVTAEERQQIIATLEREVVRLESLIREYRTVRGNTRNPSVKAMADEGAANMEDRIKNLRALIARLKPQNQAAAGARQ